MDLYSLLSLGLIFLGLAVAYRSKYPVAHTLVLINLMVFLLTVLAAWDQPSFLLSPVQRELGFRPLYLDQPERWYTAITQMFVHGDLLHVLFNMLFLYLVGVPLEERVGRRSFAIFYFLPGLLALMLESLVRGFDSSILMLGASGAISGTMGALLFLYPRDEIPMFLGPLFLPRVPVWMSVGAWFAIQVVTVLTLPQGLASGGVAYAAHIGGFVAGMGAAYLLPSPKGKEERGNVDLQDLADSDELMDIARRIEEESEPQVRRAWLEHFVSKAKCPLCSSSLTLEGNRIKCACGWERMVR